MEPFSIKHERSSLEKKEPCNPVAAEGSTSSFFYKYSGFVVSVTLVNHLQRRKPSAAAALGYRNAALLSTCSACQVHTGSKVGDLTAQPLQSTKPRPWTNT